MKIIIKDKPKDDPMDSEDQLIKKIGWMILLGFAALMFTIIAVNFITKTNEKQKSQDAKELQVAKLESCKLIESDSAREGCVWLVVGQDNEK